MLRSALCLALVGVCAMNTYAGPETQQINDELGLFSQKESRDLLQYWKQAKGSTGIDFFCILEKGNGGKLDSEKAMQLIDSLTGGSMTNTVVFYLSHSNRQIEVLVTEDLKYINDPAYIQKLKTDVLISNFERGWWQFGIKEASTRMVRTVQSGGKKGFTWSSAVWLWLVFGLALLAIFAITQRKNAMTISSAGVQYRNMLRRPPAYTKGDSEDRQFFDGGGSSTQY